MRGDPSTKSAICLASLLTASCLANFGQNNPTPPDGAAAQPAVPQGTGATAKPGGGVTINAATGQLVTNRLDGSGQPVVLRGPTNIMAVGRSNITPVQLQNINRLVIDLNALGSPTRDPVEQEKSLLATLRAAPTGTTRPSPESITKLGGSLVSLVPSLNFTAPQRRQLAIDLNLVLNSGNLSSNEAQRVVADVRGLLQGAAVKNPSGVEQLITELNSYVLQAQAMSGVPPRPTEAGQGGTTQTGQDSGGSPGPREAGR